MSYSTENAKDAVQKNMFVVLRPRIRLTSWTLDSGSVYKASCSKYVYSVYRNGTAYTLGTSTSLSASYYYYDADAEFLYIRKADSSAPSSSDWIIVTMELHLSTKDGYWYRVPTDDTTEEVFWHSLITTPPTVTKSAIDSVFGFSPVQASTVSCINDSDYFQDITYGMSANLADAIIWHQAGSISTSNFTKIFTGYMGDFDFNDGQIQFSLVDRTWQFDEKMDNGASNDRYTAEQSGPDGTDVDRAFAGKPIRSMYGDASQKLVCTTAKYDTPANTDNREWSYLTYEYGTNFPSFTVSSVISAFTFEVSDNEADIIAAAFSQGYTKMLINGVVEDIQNVDTNTNRVDTLTTNAASGGMTVYLLPYSRLFLKQGDNWYKLVYSTDYLISNDPQTFGVTLTSTVESSRGISVINPDEDFIVAGSGCGHYIRPTVSGNYFGTMFNPLVVLYHIIKDRFGVAEASIDGSSFTTAVAANDITICSVQIPNDEDSDFPSYWEVINRLLTTALCRAYNDADGKFSIYQIQPTAGSADLELTDDDLFDPSYEFSFSDTANVTLTNKFRYYSVARSKADVLADSASGVGIVTQVNEFPRVSATYSGFTYLHNSDKAQEIETYLPFGSTAISTRIAELLGERRGRLRCYIKAGAHGLELGDTVQITRTKQPGFTFDSDTTQSRKYIVMEISKEIGGVKLVLDDQKGIEDNTGDW